MKNSVRQAAAPALLALAFLSTSVWAQTSASGTAAAAATPAPATKAGKSAASHAQRHEDFVEQRINELHAQLQITPQQSQQWDAFAATMRDNAQKTDQNFKDRADKLASMNADDAMKSYATLAQVQADNMQKLSSAFSTLYSALSDDQKKTADVLFRNQRGKHRAAARRHKAGAASAPVAASN